MHFLKIIRLPNLLMMALVQVLIHYRVTPYFEVAQTLPLSGFLLLVTTTLLLAAGGYVINDVYDVDADSINKPKEVYVGITLSRKRTLYLYAILSTLGLGAGSLLCYTTEEPLLIFIFIAIVLLLYGYARYFKRLAIVGNILVSILVALTVIIIGLFTFKPYMDETKVLTDIPYIRLLWYIAVFAGLLTFLRELVKDLQDINGDYAARYATLPIILGIDRTARFSATVALACVFIIALFSFFKINYIILQAALLLGTCAPLGYIASRLWKARRHEEFARISRILKIIMLVGLLLIPFIAQNIANAQG